MIYLNGQCNNIKIIAGGHVKRIQFLLTILLISSALSGCVTQIAVGVVTTAVSVPFQVAGQVVDAVSDDEKD